MHFNENSCRPQAVTADGNKQYSVSYPKPKGGEGIAKEVKVMQTFGKNEHITIYIVLYLERVLSQ